MLEAHEYLRKRIKYSRDLLSEKDLAKASELESSLRSDLKSFPKDPAAQASLAARAESQVTRLFPPPRFAAWTDNIDVLLMAVVLALGIRAYFIQPFKIPTDSMKPTLYGIQVEPLPPDQRPHVLQLGIDWLVFGRAYCRIETKQGGVVRSIQEGRLLGIPFLPKTDVVIGSERFSVPCTAKEFIQGSGLHPGEMVPARTVAANFTVTSGDHIFVNKMVYHFRRPERGEVFVFTTHNIPAILRTMRPSEATTQFYIKRCVGLPGDRLEIDPPFLLVNGERLGGRKVFDLMATQSGGHTGYKIQGENQFLNSIGATYQVPSGTFWAMGDNSGFSFDSRGWGGVPRNNLVGTGLWVYWPVSSRWGAIR
ncbi:MAG: signal peptidase I [Verrucomicrobiia bacterium]